MKLHQVSLTNNQYQSLDGYLIQKGEFRLHDLISFTIDNNECSEVYQISSVSQDEALKEGYCIIGIKKLES